MQGGARWVRYLYFLRFALILWLFAPGLCMLNSVSSTLTSGIVTPEKWQQYFCVGFFAVSASFAALVIARTVIINGPERWDNGYNDENDGRPRLLTRLLDNDCGKYEFVAFLGSQLPTFLVFLYLLVNGLRQGVDAWQIWPGLVLGILLAACFWWLANAWYYLRYTAPPMSPLLTRFLLGKNAARTILYPRCCFHLNRVATRLPGRPTIEQATTLLPRYTFGLIGRWICSLRGYGSVRNNEPFFYEAHAFATIAMVMFGVVSIVVWSLTAPVPAITAARIVLISLTLVGIAAVFVFASARPKEGGRLRAIKMLLILGVAGFLGSVWWLHNGSAPERFPIFATVLILVTAILYALGGIGFFLDRYRVPVLTMIIVAMFVPRALHWDRTVYRVYGPDPQNKLDKAGLRLGQEEHYLSTTTFSADPKSLEVPSPAEIVAARLNANEPQPLIVVTATGGGLHASAWTAAILGRLEDKLGPAFHRRLLLLSTVSGGSVGLLSYLRELKEGTLESNGTMALRRMQSAAQCSSLEAVGWGLVYYDLPKSFVPVIPYFISPSSGVDDLHTTPLLKDRTWALRRAVERNLNNPYCKSIWLQDGNEDFSLPGNPDFATGLTLRNMAPSSTIPAFTMNTTTVERGERFLLANYKVPEHQLNDEPEYRARSFLATYERAGQGGMAQTQVDLPLATAAQMSATFPYVSSAARAPVAVDFHVDAVHFVDGGYFDNDGTASVMEFLRYALNPSPEERQTHPAVNAMDQLGRKLPRLRILLIEIRNSGDIAPTGPEARGDESGATTPWNALSQLGGPLLAFWQAGHESVTGRNRAALGLMEQALSARLELHRVVFADNNSLSVTGTDPLNWSLTPKQRAEVRSSAIALPIQEEEARCWFTQWETMWNNAHQPNPRAPGADGCFAPISSSGSGLGLHK
jgi:hypothetical protein